MFKPIKVDEIFKFTLAGIIFGMVFPVVSTSIEIIEHGLTYSIYSFLQVQRSNILLWIIDLAIPFLGIFGYLVGRQQQKLHDEAIHLESLVHARSEDILEQKLFFEALIENSPIAIVTLNPKHLVTSANPAFEEIFGYRNEEILGKNLDDIVSSDETSEVARAITKGVLSGNTMHAVGKRKRKDGSLVDVEILGTPISINSRRVGVLGLYRDITSEKNAREELQASEARFRSLFQNSPVALRLEDCSEMRTWIIRKQEESGMDIRGYLNKHPDEFESMISLAKIVSLNAASLQLFHATDKFELQKNIGKIPSEQSRNDKIDIFASLVDGKTQIEKELVYKTLSGEKIYVITKLTVLPGYESNWERVLFSNMDITERKLAEERMSYISLHDMMTGLYNRAFFDEELARLEKSRIRPISIIVLDMDNLKAINDQYGHNIGDTALKNIARIIRSCFRAEDVIARIGGDEFSVLLPGVDADYIKIVTQRIQKLFDLHNRNKDVSACISISIGNATAGKDDSLLAVYNMADKNMYLEKQKKRAAINEKGLSK